jgi:flagellar protein FlaG
MSIETTRSISLGTNTPLPKRVNQSSSAKEAAGDESKVVSMRREGSATPRTLDSIEQAATPLQGTQTEETKQKEQDRPLSFADIVDEVEHLNNASQNIQRSIEFSVDNVSDKTVITVRDSKTEEVIRQIPSEELLDISKRLKNASASGESSAGFLFSSSA